MSHKSLRRRPSNSGFYLTSMQFESHVTSLKGSSRPAQGNVLRNFEHAACTWTTRVFLRIPTNGAFCPAQGDAIRYFVLHKHGGVYLDMDVECFRNMEHTLLGADLVLQVI